MILTCPSCSASYMVPSEAIGDGGRDVRCKKCAHVWHQKSEKDTLNQLINTIQSSKEGDLSDDISFGESGRDENDPKQSALQKNINYFLRLKNASQIAGGMVAMALVSLLLLGFFTQRWTIVKFIPQLTGVYTKLGFPLASYAAVNPEDVLVIEHAELTGEGVHQAIRGNLINLTSSEVRVPSIKVGYIDQSGKKIAEDVIPAPQATLKKEASIELNLPFDASKHPGVTSVEIGFAQ